MYGQDFHDSWKTQLRPWQVTTQTFLGRKAAQPPRHPEVPPPSPSPVHHQILLGQLICPHCHHSSPSSLSCCMDSQLVSPVPHIRQSVQLLSHVWPFATPWISTLLLKKKKNQTYFITPSLQIFQQGFLPLNWNSGSSAGPALECPLPYLWSILSFS